MTLNDKMEFDHVIEVKADGTVVDAPHMYAPEVYVNLDSDGQMIGSDTRDGVDVLDVSVTPWYFMHGYTIADSSGPRSFIMHPSEFIGGRMERDILSQPGYYVAVIVMGQEEIPSGDDTTVGWAVAFQAKGE